MRHAKPFQAGAPEAAAGGLYVHVPFCIRKCPYCDFFSVTDLSLVDRVVDALAAEAALRGESATVFDSVYFGGGTPSLLGGGRVARVLAALSAAFTVAKDAEVTLEVNPGTAGARSLRDLRRAGVNRINLGAQSFRDDALAFLGRVHSAGDARDAAARALDAGFEKLGIDLIYGLPGQTADAWRFDLEAALALSPAHLSCYLLTFEPGTPMTRRREAGAFAALPDPPAAALFALTQSVLGAAGYQQYEISNFARSPDDVSRHNLKYWTGAPYLGLGPAAHSYQWPRRFWNHRDIGDYLRAVENGRPPTGGGETLDGRQQVVEAVYLGLRTAAGVEIEAFDRRFATDFNALFFEALDLLEGEGMVSRSARRCALTPKGLRFHEGVVEMMVRDL